MQTPIAIFLGLALIAGAIYNKASISCMATGLSHSTDCAVLFNGEITFVSRYDSEFVVHDIEARTYQLKELKELDEVDEPD